MQPSIFPFDLSSEYFTDERCFILEHLNIPGNPACSLARARVEPGVTTALHALVDTVEIYHILNGSGEVVLGGALVREVGTGDTVLIPAGVSQKIRNTGSSDLVFLAICCPRFTPACYRDLEGRGGGR